MTLLPSDAPKLLRRTLPGRAWLNYDAEFLALDAADQLLALVRDLVPWEERSIRIFGREVKQPRLIGWAGDVAYRYSGQTLEPRPLPDGLQPLLALVRERTGVPYNHVLFNRYRDGQDAMGMHSDDEPELGKNPTLASLSLGATRRLVIASRKKATSLVKLSLELTHGSLLIMGGTLQHVYRHGVPRQKNCSEERVNLTFRHLLTIPSP